MAEVSVHWGTGRRKTSVARVRLKPGDGKIRVNKTELEEYFRGYYRLQKRILEPFELTKTSGKFTASVNVNGGGKTGQADAIRHGISRALADVDENSKVLLKREGFLRRDPRMVERKKPGRPKAKKRFQYSKR